MQYFIENYISINNSKFIFENVNKKARPVKNGTNIVPKIIPTALKNAAFY